MGTLTILTMLLTLQGVAWLGGVVVQAIRANRAASGYRTRAQVARLVLALGLFLWCVAMVGLILKGVG